MVLAFAAWLCAFILVANPAASLAREATANPEDPAPLKKATTQLIVNVSVNKEGLGDFFVDRDDDGELYFSITDLVALKLAVTPDRTVLIRNELFAPLSAVRDVTYAFDEKSLSVAFRGKTTESRQTAIDLFPMQSRPQNVYIPSELSAFLNYGFTYAHADPLGFQSFSVANKIGASTGNMFFVSDSLYTKTDAGDRWVRLASTATYEWRSELQWLLLGDQYATSGELGSTVNMGGVGFQKVYRIDPYLITQPMFSLRGIAEYPSQAEIYMDGMLVGRHTIAPGQFDLNNIYSYNGSHNVEVVLKDPYGNEQRIAYPFYFSTQLLREGLHEYSYHAGFLREQYGIASNEYGKAAFSAFHRYGVTSAWNIGARVESSSGIQNVGVSTSFLLPRIGVINVGAAGSEAGNSRGSALLLQHAYQLGSFNTSLGMRRYSREYATIGTVISSGMPKSAVHLGVGFQLRPVGSFSLGYATSASYDGTTTRITSASYSRELTRTASFFATVSETRDMNKVFAAYLGINVLLDKNLHGSVSVNRTGKSNTETMQVQKDTPVGEGLGYRGTIIRSDSAIATDYSLNPALDYHAKYAAYSLNSSFYTTNDGSFDSHIITAAGAIVYAGGFWGLSRPVNDSFNIVMLDAVPNATVMNNGQPIGTTDESGKVIVPTLSPYNQNQITLDTKDLPMDYSIASTSTKISPSLWSGSCVAFDVLKIKAVTGRLVAMVAGKKMPMEYLDALLLVNGKDIPFSTGKSGEFYVENSLPSDAPKDKSDNLSCSAIAMQRKTGSRHIQPGSYGARIAFEGGGQCEFTITFTDAEEVISDLGEVTCTVRK